MALLAKAGKTDIILTKSKYKRLHVVQQHTRAETRGTSLVARGHNCAHATPKTGGPQKKHASRITLEMSLYAHGTAKRLGQASG